MKNTESRKVAVSHRHLSAHVRTGAKGHRQGFLGQAEGCHVGPSLRRSRKNLSLSQLRALDFFERISTPVSTIRATVEAIASYSASV